jgi:hypothetical protein
VRSTRKHPQVERAPTEAGYGKAGKQEPLSNFSTATTTTKYIQVWDTDSRGKATEAPDKTVGVLADFKFQLKKEMLESSFCAKHLAFDDYDRCFRDACFWGISNGVVLVDGPDPDVIAEGLKKYERRLKDTFRKTVGIDVEFQMAEMSGAAETALAPTGRQVNANG